MARTKREHSYCVYIMSSLSRTLYTGVTNDLDRRVLEHKETRTGTFTATYRVNGLVYFEEYRYVNNAIDREKEIKKLTRRRKIKLIEEMNPEWKDLSVRSNEDQTIRDSSRARHARE